MLLRHAASARRAGVRCRACLARFVARKRGVPHTAAVRLFLGSFLVATIDPESRIKIGQAVRTLEEEIPDLLVARPTLSIFSPTVVVTDRVLFGMQFVGTGQYAWALAAARVFSRLFVRDPRIRILSVHRLTETTLTVRWALHGDLYKSLPAACIGMFQPSRTITTAHEDASRPPVLEGIFRYHFNSAGLIDNHVIDNVLPRPTAPEEGGKLKLPKSIRLAGDSD